MSDTEISTCLLRFSPVLDFTACPTKPSYESIVLVTGIIIEEGHFHHNEAAIKLAIKKLQKMLV